MVIKRVFDFIYKFVLKNSHYEKNRGKFIKNVYWSLCKVQRLCVSAYVYFSVCIICSLK